MERSLYQVNHAARALHISNIEDRSGCETRYRLCTRQGIGTVRQIRNDAALITGDMGEGVGTQTWCGDINDKAGMSIDPSNGKKFCHIQASANDGKAACSCFDKQLRLVGPPRGAPDDVGHDPDPWTGTLMRSMVPDREARTRSPTFFGLTRRTTALRPPSESLSTRSTSTDSKASCGFGERSFAGLSGR